MTDRTSQNWLMPAKTFLDRHVGPTEDEIREMLNVLGFPSLETLIHATVPEDIRLHESLNLPAPRSEQQVVSDLRRMARKNHVFRSFIGMGYYDCHTPPVILRNMLENPAWYTQYTPYQAEIAQGRLEALLNFQTMVADLTGLPLANASLLDEGTAAAEAHGHVQSHHRPAGVFRLRKGVTRKRWPWSRTRAASLGIHLEIGTVDEIDWKRASYGGLLLQYPTTDGTFRNCHDLVGRAHDAGHPGRRGHGPARADPLQTTGRIRCGYRRGIQPALWGSYGIRRPACRVPWPRAKPYKRQMPGRIVGVSKDSQGRTAYRLALQTREQHIRRDRATSNICTAQVLLANIAGMYAVYHGPDGLKRIAERVHGLTLVLAEGLTRLGCRVPDELFFDTLRVSTGVLTADRLLDRAEAASSQPSRICRRLLRHRIG